MNCGTAVNSSLDCVAQTVDGITIAELTSELDLASAPALREQLLSLLRPGYSSLVIDLSKVSFADASGLAVLVSAARRARLLGGFLRLAAVSPPTGQALRITGLDRNLAIFPTVRAAATGPRALSTAKRAHPVRGGTIAAVRPSPAIRSATPWRAPQPRPACAGS
jgi:anti-anti-sigma factor